jgi:acyl-CoA hydrolase
LAPRLQKGVLLHGGFFLGPKDFYRALRDLPDAERRQFNMTSVGFTNQLYGADSELKTLQRAEGRFINTTMMVTVLGAAVSDGLEDGRVVSGVGGQYNFVAMAHALPGARSILAVRSTRTKGGKVTSNILWNYGHTTIPRHLRDIVITEYGIADLRGKTDSEVIAALLNVADSRFQEPLLARAKQAGKIARSYRIPDAHRGNTPQAIEAALAGYRKERLFPEFPFGTDFTAEEVVLAKALRQLKDRTSTLSGKTVAVAGALVRSGVPDRAKPYLERMALDQPKTFGEKLMRNLIAAELIEMT